MRFFFQLILFFSFISYSIYYAYTNSDPDLTDSEYQTLTLKNEKTYISSMGQDRKVGNIVGIQTFMTPVDYSTPERFYDKLEFYVIKAKQSGFIKDRTLLVFPEHIATPLFLMEEKKKIYSAKSWKEIQNYLKISNYFYQKNNTEFTSDSPIPLAKSLLIQKSEKMRSAYVETFRRLATSYNVNILAGSIVLPNPNISNNELIIDQGEMKDISIMLDKKGIIANIFEKNELYTFEKEIMVGGVIPPSSNPMPGFTNKVVIIFSSDSLHNKFYTKQVYNTDLWISPSFKLANSNIDWSDNHISGDPRYDSKAIFQESENLLSPKALWSKYGISGKFQYFPSKYYIEIFFKGEFYDLELDGWSSYGIKSMRQEFVDKDYHSAILNLNL
ncbi:MAG: hypothetical protein KDK54_03835 [Leptospiraceae bacterium]|nr:hypothetical protein [Leptospiraceae bacterium]